MSKHKLYKALSVVAIAIFLALALVDLYYSRVDLALKLVGNDLARRIILVLIAGFYTLFGASSSLLIWSPKIRKRTFGMLKSLFHYNRWLRWSVGILVAALPAIILIYTPLGDVFQQAYFRLILVVASSFILTHALASKGKNPPDNFDYTLSFLIVASLIAMGTQFREVTNYPFSLHWSEGNRLYDYSVLLGSDRYNYTGDLKIPYNAPGRYLLWGILFLIPNTPIWLHRLWNAILTTVPFIGLGYLLASNTHFDKQPKWTFALWVYLFLIQGPIYTPLILSAIILVFSVKFEKFWLALAGVLLAGYYASISRWTWMPAVGTWAVILLIGNINITQFKRVGDTIKKLSKPAVAGIVGYLGGLLGDPKLITPAKLTNSTAFAQPLLWYRLFPNPTYREGVLLGLALATLPLIAILIWLVASKRVSLHWIQITAFSLAVLAFLSIGLVASMKIGGGNNLHNLDMYLVTLALLTGIFLTNRRELFFMRWHKFMYALLSLTILLPAWQSIHTAKPLNLPTQNETQQAMNILRNKVAIRQKLGEVLFIDQRQLLTFSYVSEVAFYPEYEKKYLMDQAMAGNTTYFEGFYRDLKEKRFALIIIDPLFLNTKDNTRFSEENNAWVNWVARPVLCYYAPIYTFADVNVQLLVPKAGTPDCEDDLPIPHD